MDKTFFISTAIDYPSGPPHLGHCYEKICADVIARWHRLKGEKVHFSTGLDEHGLKIYRNAEKENKSPQEFIKDMGELFMELCEKYDISYDDFIRTTEKRHEKSVNALFKKVYAQGDIYKGHYEGLYCVDCETYYTEKDLVDGNCPVHKKPVEPVREESYFFKMSKYQDKLINYIKKNEFVLPDKKKNEILNRLKEPLRDLSISRTSFSWGIPFPIDKKHVMYVWFDALTNYLTTIGYPDAKYKKLWPANVHLIGSDIVWHHAVVWPIMLMAAGIKPPKTVFVHGFINAEGGIKMSKSLGNVVDPLEIAKYYPVDSIRYFLLREIPFGEDGAFSEVKLVERHNQELANDLGNLLRRTTVLIEKNFEGKIPAKGVDDLCKKLDLKKINEYIDKLELHNALNELWKFVNECNKYVNDQEPWNVKDKKKLGNILYNLVEALRFTAIILQPFMPATSEEIARQLGINGFEKQTFKDLKYGKTKYSSIGKNKVLFEKIEIVQKKAKMEEEKMVKEHGKEIHQEDKIPFAEFQKIDLRVGKITKVQPHPDADKLYILLVDLGEGEHNIQLVAGLRGYYKEEELMNKQIVVVRNLQPATLRGVESQGMLLAAEFKGKVVLISPEKDIETGAKIR
ncbi:MAG: methionine--tRNA ligase [Nanoarchaeota archaeon]|nr:methionine--tRNA ligase [Nanoarchaeota archaeon]